MVLPDPGRVRHACKTCRRQVVAPRYRESLEHRFTRIRRKKVEVRLSLHIPNENTLTAGYNDRKRMHRRMDSVSCYPDHLLPKPPEQFGHTHTHIYTQTHRSSTPTQTHRHTHTYAHTTGITHTSIEASIEIEAAGAAVENLLSIAKAFQCRT
eukprot:GHVU01157887.1.p1 GENE.GHVU01157887.1~~GHVU01157887.1.p1  ORF type:complete len:153 (-),score=7.72 GHVU01157887.1:463-921(-)